MWVCSLIVATLASPHAHCDQAGMSSVARLQHVEVVTTDGADRLDCTVVLGEVTRSEPVILETHAFVIEKEKGSSRRYVMAADAADADLEGRFRVRRTVRRDDGRPVIRATMLVPRRSLRLADDDHRLAYEITVKCNDRMCERYVTHALPIDGGIVARSQKPDAAHHLPLTHTTRTKAFFSSAASSGRAAEPIERTIEVPPPTRVDPWRQHVQGLPTTAGDARQDDLRQLENMAWSSTERTVMFATNRQPLANGRAGFGSDVGSTVSYGTCRVNIPVMNHVIGGLEEPTWFTKPDPERHFLVKSTGILQQADFLEHVRDGDVLLFVHGFYTSFDSAVLRLAQLQLDLDFPGPAVVFAWPSLNSLTQYQDDTERAARSASSLADVIRTLAARSRETAGAGRAAGKIHVIAHSLGNRVLLHAMQIACEQDPGFADTKPFGQVVLAAPDVSAITFNNLLPFVTQVSDQVTYYYSPRDDALRVSQKLNASEPIGLYAYFDPLVSTINAQDAGMSVLFHNYYASTRAVLLDVHLLLSRGLGPDQRMPPLVTRTLVYGRPVWSFGPPADGGDGTTKMRMTEDAARSSRTGKIDPE